MGAERTADRLAAPAQEPRTSLMQVAATLPPAPERAGGHAETSRSAARGNEGRALDALDVEILRHTMYVATDPVHAARGMLGPWQIARRLGVHGTTVKARLATLRANGVLRGVVLAPHLSILGARLFHFGLSFETPAAKDAALRQAARSPDVYVTRDFVGTEAWIGLLAPDPERAGAQASDLARAWDARAVDALYETRPPPVDVAPRPVDRRILRALAADAHLDVETVARHADTSPRTVRRRLARMGAARAFSVFLDVDLGAMSGAVTILLEVQLADAAAAQRVLQAFPDWAHRENARPDLVLLYLSAPDLVSVQETARRACALPGVVAARPRFLLGATVNPRAIERALDAAGAQSSPRA